MGGRVGPARSSNASEGKGPQKRPQQRLGRRFEEVAKAVRGDYCRLQVPLKLAPGVTGTMGGHRLDALEGGGGYPSYVTFRLVVVPLRGAGQSRFLGRPCCHRGGNRAVTSQPHMGQSTSYGDVKSSYGGGRRVGQKGVRNRGTQERPQTGGGATQTHRTREPHQEGQGRAQQPKRRGTARQERQLEQREHGPRMEGMGERAHGRQRQ